MLLQDLLAYLFVFALAILIVVQVVRSIRNARRVRLGFNAGICADCNTRWHHEYDYAGEDHQYRCKCGKHTLPTSSFVDCALIPEPTAETFMDTVTRMVANNVVTLDVGHRMRLLLQKMPQDRVFENLHLINRDGVLILQGRDGNRTRQLRVGQAPEPKKFVSEHVAYYDAEGPQECETDKEVTELLSDLFLMRVLFLSAS
jgi:hypothetical protein